MSGDVPARYPQIDVARGVAIGMMVLYHTAFDLATFGDFPLEPMSGFWLFLSHFTAASFIFLAGLVLPISHARAVAAAGTDRGLWLRYLLRGARIFNWGLILTLVTWWLFPQAPIIFGILHLIGVVIAVSYPLLRRGVASIALGVAGILTGLVLRGVEVAWPWLVWLGVRPVGFASLDYRPLLPWLGVALVGIGVGNLLLARAKGCGVPATRRPSAVAAALALAGRHSLAIYLIHQPVLIVLLWALGLIDPGFLP